MKKFILLFLILISSVFSVQADTTLSPEMFLLLDHDFSIVIHRIEGSIVKIENMLETFSRDDVKFKFSKIIFKIEKVTGLDLRNKKKLLKFGLNPDKSVIFSYKKNKNIERMMVVLPVINNKKILLNFARFINKFNQIYPVITSYKGKSIYQSGKDIFYTFFNGYLIIANQGETLKEVFDMYLKNLDTEERCKPKVDLKIKKNNDSNKFIKGEVK